MLLADLDMPGMSGASLARQVRECRELDLVILTAVTGWTDSKHRELAAAAGFQEYLLKPVPLDRLCDLLKRVAERITQSQQQAERSIIVANEGTERARQSLKKLDLDSKDD